MARRPWGSRPNRPRARAFGAPLAALLLALLTACAPVLGSDGRASPSATTRGADGTDPDHPKGADRERPPGGDDDTGDDDDGASTNRGNDQEDASPPVDTTELDPFFQEQMEAANIPGISVAVVGGGRLKWAKGYGLANIEKNRKVTKDTLFMLASVSKTVMAVALMQLIEDPARGLKLDQSIDAKLPFSVRNPNFPSTPITYRMLLTHTSTLIDSDAFWDTQDSRPQGDDTGLLAFEEEYVAQDDSWSTARPGTKYEYSNTGAALAGLLIERISGMNLQDYCKKNIFDRLGMTESSWFLRGLDQTHIAMPYHGDELTPKGFYGYPDYPDGALRTSAPQLSRFLRMFAQNGKYKDQRILTEATVLEMRREQVPSLNPGQGLIWYTETKDGTRSLGHNGADDGVMTSMFFDPKTGAGYVLLTNVRETAGLDDALDAMANKLMQLAKTLP